MSRITRSVKGKRSYDASQRRQKARRSRDRIIEMAQRRFLRDGYGPTTISAIAEDAGVSVDTIYKSFGGKPGLIRAMGARALEGRGPVPAEQRSDELQALERDPRRLISGGECSSPRSRPWLRRSCSWFAMPPEVIPSSGHF